MNRFLKNTLLISSFILFSAPNAFALFGIFENKPKPQAATHQSADQYLQAASSSASSVEQQNNQLLAVSRLLLDHQIGRATQILNTIHPPENSPNLVLRKLTLLAKIDLANKQPEKAIQTLLKMTPNEQIILGNRIAYHQTLADAFIARKDILKSIEQRDLLNELLPTKEEKLANAKEAWALVETLSEADIDTLLDKPQSPSIQGWIELASITHQLSNNPEEFSHRIAEWRKEFPKHPGNSILPSKIRSADASDPHNIYVLVPLTGQFGSNGEAIRDGFLTAYYQHKSSLKYPLQIHVVDTNNQDVINLYRHALQEDADFIVGPLTKGDIQRLTAKETLSVPTLVLNQTNSRTTSNLYQFGLSQQQETLQIAERAKQDGHQRAIVIAPTGEWGQSITDEFQTRWKQLGGEVVETLAFDNQENLAEQIRSLLQVNESESRAENLHKLLKEDIRFVPRRRQDVDFIFLVATSQQAKTIRPMLKFYFAGDLPIYATSLVDDGHGNDNSELENIVFAQMPWLTKELSPALQTLQTQGEAHYAESNKSQPKFFAMGIDAYHLCFELNRLRMFPRHSIDGATGTLSLQSNQQIYRKLKWAKIQQGSIKPI